MFPPSCDLLALVAAGSLPGQIDPIFVIEPGTMSWHDLVDVRILKESGTILRTTSGAGGSKRHSPLQFALRAIPWKSGIVEDGRSELNPNGPTTEIEERSTSVEQVALDAG